MRYPIPNTFGIDACCSQLIEFSSVEQLLGQLTEIQEAKEQGNLLIVGRGSNLLPTSDYDGTVVRSRIQGHDIVSSDDNNVLVRCGSGETVDDVIQWAIDNHLYGLENLSYIPGEVGASAVQNIGAYGSEAKDFIDSIEAVEIMTGKTVVITNSECHYAYRYSRFKDEWKNRFIIISVTYKLSKTFFPHLDYGNICDSLSERGISEPTAQQLRDVIIDIRKSKLPDPQVEGNAGSFFMNPIVPMEKYVELAERYPGMPHYSVDESHEKIPAGWMIDQCGWKGRTVSNAGVHDRQALVLVNRGGASGSEIVHLCEMIQRDVKDKFGIEIRPEVNIV